MLTPLIAGNWKMNGLGRDLVEAGRVADSLAAAPARARVAICPPATLLTRMAEALTGSVVALGGQDCHAGASGAFTGDISAEMLADAGARLVIVGHSERREGHGETDAMVAAKAMAARRAGLEPIICVGETRAERDAGLTLEVIRGQVAGSVPAGMAEGGFALAYEPIWAIGAGSTPTADEIAAAHTTLREALIARCGAAGRAAPILYGGSVKPDNAAEILKLAEVGGALVGGASLKAADFLAIIRAAI
ncbi:MAG TPA: triose-phosphate isomerase [Caulobacteraceae bacterium]|jgi:triosephosphate isomerase|nr:triose-phosphate isomerase [Caulobacteraceae bacterium]